MSDTTPTPTLKRHNHKVHPCKDEKKEELLELLLNQNSDKKIIVVTSQKSELTSKLKDVVIVSDEELLANKELKCDMLISYDLPSKAISYISRIARANTYALLLVNPSEERVIHPIETLLGRTIMQEIVDGFSEVREEKQAQPSKKEFKPRENNKEFRSDKKPWEDKPKKSYRDDSKNDKKPWEDKPKKSYRDDSKNDKKPWEKKEKNESKYIGKDENGKAIFSGKTGDRNHHYDGTPKAKPTKLTGKRISIKSLKKKEE